MENASFGLADSPQDIVGIRDAADALNVSPSTISRQVAKGIIPNRGSAEKPKVSISEARRSRAANIDQAQQRVPHRQAPEASAPGFQAHRTAHEEVKAKKAALELATLQGELLSRKDVEDFLATAGRQLRDRLIHRWRTLSVEFEGLSARDIEAKGVATDEQLLKALADEFVTWSSDAAGAA